MSASSCSVAFAYDKFYAEYLSLPLNKGLMDRSHAVLPFPKHFSSHNPRDCCLLALHGHIIYSYDERSAKDCVKDGGSYCKTVATRMRLFEEMVDEFNTRQQQSKRFFGSAITITIDDGPVVGSFPLADYGGAAIVEAAPQYELDRSFVELGQSARLNRFAQEYGFPNFQQLREFLVRLDEEARCMGFPSYDAICVPSRYLTFLQDQLASDEDMQPTLVELAEKSDLLQQQTAFTIERFVACRRPENTSRDFFVDVTREGVVISLHGGILETGVVSSMHLSHRSQQFHAIWFA